MLFNCSTDKNENVLWKFNSKSDYTPYFSIKHSKVLLFTFNNLECFNLKTKRKEWENNEIDLHSTPTITEDEIITGTRKNNKIYHIDISNGKYIKEHSIDGNAIITKTVENLLYFIMRKDKHCTLNVLNLLTTEITKLFDFEDYISRAKTPFVVYGNTIVISLELNNRENAVYSINKNTGELKWEKRLSNKILPFQQNIAHYEKSIFYVDIQKNSNNNLVEVDIETGAIKNNIILDEIYSSWIDFDGENILIHGKKLYIYNIQEKIIENVIDKYNVYALLSNGKIIYDIENTIYLYDIKEKTSKEIYSLNGKDRFLFFTNGKYVLLSFADNIKEALADNKDLTYVLLKLED